MVDAVLRRPAEAHRHLVGFYADDCEFVAAVVPFLAEGLAAGEAVVVLATPAHRAALEAALHDLGVALDDRYRAMDAAETLTRFMVEGRPDPLLFEHVIGEVLDEAAAAGTGVRAFGEMVALLWDDGAPEAAVEVEQLWNELGEERAFTLLCAYRLGSLADAALAAVAEMCATHGDVLPPLAYAGDQPSMSAMSAPSTGVADEASCVFVPAGSAPRAARRFVADTVAAWGAAEVADDAELVLSELAANVLLHVGTPFRVVVTRGDDAFRIAVHDSSPDVPMAALPADDAVRGRGLVLVAALSRRWGVDHLPDGKVVWAELALLR